MATTLTERIRDRSGELNRYSRRLRTLRVLVIAGTALASVCVVIGAGRSPVFGAIAVLPAALTLAVVNIYPSTRRSGERLYVDMAHVLGDEFRSGRVDEATDRLLQADVSTADIALKSFGAARDIPPFPGRYAVNAYTILNVFLLLGGVAFAIT